MIFLGLVLAGRFYKMLTPAPWTLVTLSKQTLQEVFYPEHDDGFKLWHNNTKKKKKVCKL